MSYGAGDTLKTLGPKGEVPECRMKDAASTQDFVRRMIDNDAQRAWKRSRVNGLVDGNPPYKASRLRSAGRADAANFNTGNARSYMESGSGAFYDLITEAPSRVSFRSRHGTVEQRNVWSDIASKEADKVLMDESAWDFQQQISQWEMTLHGSGPFFFEDAYTVFPRAAQCGDLKVPEFTKADTAYWEAAMIQVPYYPAELYKYIQNETAAKAVGWNVDYTKKVIYNAMGIQQDRGVQYDWEFFQQQMKNNSFFYLDDDSKVCQLAHVFWQEFPKDGETIGRITHAIVERDSSVGTTATTPSGETTGVEYLFLHVGRYKNWKEVVHPMYFDRGNGGYHHSVTGLGVKMYSLMEYENRLTCNLCDKAFSPKILFKPTTTEAAAKFELQRLGDFAVMPAGYEWQQTGVAGLMNDGLAMREVLTETMQGTLSNYKSAPMAQKSGNPVTKFEKQMQAAQQSALSMPQFNRYYAQMDALIAEIWRRLTNPNTIDERAKMFQKRCKEQGVPTEALLKVEYVGATRVVGQGSAFMRKQAVDSILPLAGSLPEEGRNNLINDKIAAEAGQSAVSRYNPKQLKQPLATDAQVEALHCVGDMKQGIPPLVASSQNPVTFAATYLKAASDALQSLQQGANPMDVLAFMGLCGPAISAQLRRFGQDPTRAEIHQQMIEQWKQLAAATDKLKQMVQKQQQDGQKQQQRTQQAMTDQQIAQAKAQSDIQIKTQKTQAQLQQSQEKHRLKLLQASQDMAIKDASAAADIRINRLKAFQSSSKE